MSAQSSAVDASHRTSPSGGIAETKKIPDMAEAYYQTLVPHNIGSPVATVATTRVGATIPDFYGLEYHAREVEWWDDLIVGEDLPERRTMTVDDESGLGIKPDWDAVEAHRKE